MSAQPKTFCKAPFKTAVIDTGGQLLPCCEFMTSESDLPNSKLNFSQDWHFEKWWKKGLDPLRDKMLRGEMDKGCRYCIKKEQLGLQSLRQGINQAIGETYEEIKKDYLNKKREYPVKIELRLGNYCNLKCIMCGPYASSSIDAEYKMNQKTYNDFGIVSHWKDPYMPKDWYSYTHNKKIMLDVASKAKRIYFGGGEPFISPVLLEVLEHIKHNTIIGFNTNMTKINDRVINALRKFEMVYIDASIDGVGIKNDYIRNGSSWNIVEQNIKTLKTLSNVKLELSYILQHTSLYTLKGVIEFAHDNNIRINFGEIYDKSVDGSGHLTINSAQPKDVDRFKEWLDTAEFEQKTLVQNWINSYSYDKSLNKRFIKYIEMLDKIRYTKFSDTFLPLS